MEATENKIIVSKLEELTTLPDDYQPNLDSKWALLEASLSGKDKNKQRILFWMRAAAALIILGLAGMWMQSENRVKVLADTKTNNNPESQPAHAEESVSQQQPAIRFQSELNVAATFTVKKTPAKRTEKVEKIQQANEPIREIATRALRSETKDSASSIVEVPAQIAEVSETPTKKKKGRYVQLDFDDSIGESSLNPPEQNLLVKNIKITLPKNRDTRNSNSANPHEALFKVNF
jgi:hypothetical protein